MRDVINDDVCILSGKFHHDSLPDAAISAGYDSNFTF
jgi:hypothetical protein